MGRQHAAAVAVLASVMACIAVLFAQSAAAATVLWAGGTSGSLGRLLPAGLFGTEESFLAGGYRQDDFSVVDYPASMWPITGIFDPSLGRSVTTGAANIEAAARSTPGPVVLAGVSQGAMVVQRAQAELDDDPAIPSDTTFIIIANPNLGLLRGGYGHRYPVFRYTPEPPAETRFTTIVVVNEYDGWADPIARPRNLLTVANAVMGLIYVHPYAQNSDLSTVPADNITTVTNSQGGTTTTYLVPTTQLPLTRPLRQLGVPGWLVDDIGAALRPTIDAGYDRGPGKTASQPASPTAHNLTALTRRSPKPAVSASAPPRGSSSRPDVTGTSAPR